MQVDVREDRGVHVVSVEGELNLLTCGVFFNRVVEMRRKPGTRIVLDLQALTFLDSMGAGQIWKTVESARAEGGNAVLARVPAHVRRVIDLVGISDQVVVADSVDDAVKTLLG